MTLIAVLPTTELFIIADSRISRDGRRVQNTALKLGVYDTRYRYPVVAFDEFRSFSEVHGPRLVIGYAGLTMLFADISVKFQEVIEKQIFLRRVYPEGTPQLCVREDEWSRAGDEHWMDNYNFDQSEMPNLTLDYLVGLLQETVDQVCSDYGQTFGQDPEIQIVVAAKDKGSETWGAEVLECLSRQSNGAAVITRSKVSPGDFGLIGTGYAVSRVRTNICAEPLYKAALARAAAPDPNLDFFDEMNEREQILDHQIQSIRYYFLQEMAYGTTAIGGEAKFIDTRQSSKLKFEVLTEQEVQDLYAKGI